MNEPIAVTAEQAAPRCVVLLKSVQIAHQAGFYLLNGRWHKHHQDKPAPKGVPVVAAKPASGHTRMTGEMWEKVYAHAENSNKATYVKKLDKLKDAYYAGDTNAILAGSYPNDTTNKKVVLVANYLLGLMGSEHTVTPGLKLGTHPALAGAATATPSAPAPVAETPAPVQEVPAVAPDPEPVVVVPVAPESGPGVLETPPSGLPMPDFVEGKTTQGVVDYYQAVAKEIQALHAAGDAAGLEKMKADGLVPSDKGKVGNTWKGKTENSKMILAMQAEALQQLGAGAAPSAIPNPEPAAPPGELPDQPVTGKIGMLIAVDLAGSASAAADAGFKYLKDNGTTEETVGHVVQALQEKGYSDMAGKFQAALDTANKIKADAAAAKEAPAPDDGPKEGDTKQGADGMLVLKDGHWVKADQGEPGPTAPDHPVDLVPMPDLSDLNNPAKANAALEALKDQVKEQGLSALKGLTKKMKSSGKLITTLPGGSGYKIIGYEHLSHKSHAQIYHYVEALKAAAGGKPAVKSKAAEPAAPAAAPAPEFPSMDGWQQIGPQAGSNAGGKFVDPEGGVWYCKFPKDENIAKSEVLAAKLYAAAGIAGQDAQLVMKDGKVGIASKWVDVSKASPAALAKAKGAKAGFAVDAWLANHDVIGMDFDNLQIDANGNAVRVDAGGSLEYRAQGAKKEFGNSVTEIETLRDKAINDKSAAVFGKMTKADITASVANVLKVSSAQIYALVNTYGPGTPEEKAKLAATLVARKADLLAKYPKAKKEKKIVFKPEDISAPPSFINWGGQGTSGPSSKEFINLANEKAVQSIYTAAQTGDPEKVKGLSAETYNKATGEVTGTAPVLEHPSQHVKGYAQQALNEIHQQLNPPKVFRFDGGHPLHSLNDAYPALNSAKHGENVEKAGKFLVLGSPGVLDVAVLGLTPSSWANGKLTQATYSPAAHAIVKAMPVTQKQAIVSYTGAGYGAMNSSLWSGNPSGASKSAAEALHTLGHEIVPGTILSRKLSLSGAGLDQILASTGKILQEPAIMSTSIRPSSWSGNTQLKLHVGPGVKGLWVGKGSNGGNSGLSQHQGEDEMILPPNTRILVLSVKKANGPDADGFGNGINHVIEAVILPSEQPAK